MSICNVGCKLSMQIAEPDNYRYSFMITYSQSVLDREQSIVIFITMINNVCGCNMQQYLVCVISIISARSLIIIIHWNNINSHYSAHYLFCYLYNNYCYHSITLYVHYDYLQSLRYLEKILSLIKSIVASSTTYTL